MIEMHLTRRRYGAKSACRQAGFAEQYLLAKLSVRCVLPTGLALPTACAKAIGAYAKAMAPACGGASGYAKATQAGFAVKIWD